MAYRLRYSVLVDWVPPGMGLGINYQTTQIGPQPAGGPAQTLEFVNSAVPVSSTFTSSDITSLLSTLTTDISAQMNAAATLARVQGFATAGG